MLDSTRGPVPRHIYGADDLELPKVNAEVPANLVSCFRRRLSTVADWGSEFWEFGPLCASHDSPPIFCARG